MKNSIYISSILLIFSYLVSGQCSDMDIQQYQNLKFNNHSLSSIANTYGNPSQVQAVFQNSLAVSTGDEPDHWIKFNSSELELRFDDGVEERSINQPLAMRYTLTILKVKSSNIPVLFNGLEINVGDNIQVLGNNVGSVVVYPDGRRSACYKIGSETLAFYISPTNIITSIQYQYYN